MSKVSEFYDALLKDPAMQERAKSFDGSKPENDEVALELLVGFAKKEGYDFTADEAKAYLSEKNKGELNDDQLEAVAGGATFCMIVGVHDECCCVFFGNS